MWLFKGNVFHLGSRGPEVQRLQELLNKSLPSGLQLRVDGDFGPQTEAAIRVFQASVGISIDGIPGPQTIEALQNGLSEKHRVPPVPPINIDGAPWMKIANLEIGQCEIRGSQNNPRVIEYHATTTYRARTDEVAWCSSFVNWCLGQVGITGTKSALAASWLHWGKASAAKEGAITVIHNFHAAGSKLTWSGYHVGFLVQDGATHVVLLGGNQSGSVKLSRFSRASWRVVGYRWPDQ